MKKGPTHYVSKQDLAKILFGERRSGCCVSCGREVGKFRDRLSVREYRISGLCQECQDGVFGGDGDEPEKED